MSGKNFFAPPFQGGTGPGGGPGKAGQARAIGSRYTEVIPALLQRLHPDDQSPRHGDNKKKVWKNWESSVLSENASAPLL